MDNEAQAKELRRFVRDLLATAKSEGLTTGARRHDLALALTISPIWIEYLKPMMLSLAKEPVYAMMDVKPARRDALGGVKMCRAIAYVAKKILHDVEEHARLTDKGDRAREILEQRYEEIVQRRLALGRENPYTIVDQPERSYTEES
jgi:hypothetical protein